MKLAYLLISVVLIIYQSHYSFQIKGKYIFSSSTAPSSPLARHFLKEQEREKKNNEDSVSRFWVTFYAATTLQLGYNSNMILSTRLVC